MNAWIISFDLGNGWVLRSPRVTAPTEISAITYAHDLVCLKFPYMAGAQFRAIHAEETL